MKVAVVIITYNLDSRIFLLQVAALKKYCKDEYVIEVFDNSYVKELAKGIKYHCDRLGISYKRTKASSKDGSDSHAFAANFAYGSLKDKYDYFFFADHDLIPLEPFSVVEILGIKLLAGVGQGLKAKYLWPGCLLFNSMGIDKELIDFTPSHDLGLDTGAGFYKVIEKYGEENCIFFNEEYVQNDEYKGHYSYFSLINDGMFMHFINSSGWNHVPDNEARMNSLLNIATLKVNGVE